MKHVADKVHWLAMLAGTVFLAIALLLFQNGNTNTHRALAARGDAPPAPVVRINQVMAGANGLSKIQFIELQTQDGNQKCWGPAQPGDACYDGSTTENTGRYMLLFFDQNGNQTGRYVFMHNPGGTANTVLVATADFAALPGAPAPDFIMSKDVIPGDGQVCFRGNLENTNASAINLCLSYGGFPGPQQNNAALGDPVAGPFTGPPNGQPVTARRIPTNETLPVLDAVSLNRTVDAFGNQVNSDFARSLTPIAHNSNGQTYTFTALDQVTQGENLFDNETFLGNGRPCAACHREQDHGGLSPETVASLPPDDPLFVAEYNLNTITLDAASFPSDLRGTITAANGLVATQVYGSMDTYMIYGGSADLVGQVVTDTQGNSGTVAAFTAGDLAPQPGLPFSGLEDPTLMHSGRPLILENPDGFDQYPVMRVSPNLINVAFTNPYGQSGEIGTLTDFSPGALKQHMTRSLARVEGVDFRTMTLSENSDLKAYMSTIQVGASHNWDLNFFATTEAQKRGRGLFMGHTGSCIMCHHGPRLNEAVTLPVNQDFITGVANLPINIQDGLPIEREVLTDITNTRKFNSTQLWGLRYITFLMHEGSSHNLHDAVDFYNSQVFKDARNGAFGNETLTADQVNDLTAFLDGLVDYPFEFTRSTNDFGSRAPNSGPSRSQRITVTNTGTGNLQINSVKMNGDGASQFAITSLPNPAPFGPGRRRNIGVAFSPTQSGLFCATLEFTVTNSSTLENFPVGVPVRGTGTGAVIGPPVVTSPIGNQTNFFENPVAPFTFTVGENNATTNCLTLTAHSSDQTVVPDSGLEFGGTYTDRSIMVIPVFDAFGETTITVTVSDGTQSTTDSFLMTILSTRPQDCPSQCLRSESIVMSSTPTGVNALVTVKDELGNLISDATVGVTWTLPDGTNVKQNRLTDATGIASFDATGGSGLYTIHVDGIVKLGMAFDPLHSTQLTGNFTK